MTNPYVQLRIGNQEIANIYDPPERYGFTTIDNLFNLRIIWWTGLSMLLSRLMLSSGMSVKLRLLKKVVKTKTLQIEAY